MTVKDIIREAEINRSTFYSHYEDKYDLLEQIEQELLDEFEKINVDAAALTDDKCEAEIKALMEGRAELLRKHGKFLAQIFGEGGDPSFAGKLGDSVGKIWADAHIIETVSLPKNYIQAAIISTFTGLLGEWIQGGFMESPEEFASIAVAVMESFSKGFLTKRS